MRSGRTHCCRMSSRTRQETSLVGTIDARSSDHLRTSGRCNPTSCPQTLAHHTIMSSQVQETLGQPVVPDKVPTGEYPVSNWRSAHPQWPHIANNEQLIDNDPYASYARRNRDTY